MRTVHTYVKFYKKCQMNGRYYGFALGAQPQDKEIYFDESTGPRRITAGVSEPEFGEILNFRPQASEPVVLRLNHRNEVIAWGLDDFYQKALQKIARRPIYRVIRLREINGDKVPYDGDGVVFEGTVEQLADSHPRSGHRVCRVDQFAPTFANSKCGVYHHTFQVKEFESLVWVPVSEDPRPFPNGPIYRVMFRRNGKLSQLAYGTALKIAWDMPRGEKDPLAFKKCNGEEDDGCVIWQVQGEADPKTGKHLFTEIDYDPRPAPVEVKVDCHQKSAQPRAAQPGKMPKQNKPSVVVLKDLSEIKLAE